METLVPAKTPEVWFDVHVFQARPCISSRLSAMPSHPRLPLHNAPNPHRTPTTSPFRFPHSSLLLIRPLPPASPQNPLPATDPPPPPPLLPLQILPAPPPQLIHPPTAHQHARDHVHQLHQQRQEAAARLRHREEDGFDVELEEDARDGLFGDGVRGRRDGVLVREDGGGGDVGGGGEGGLLGVLGGFVGGVGVGGGGEGEGKRGEGRGVHGAGVDGGDDGEVVLEAVEVVWGGSERVVEGVEEGGVERAEGEFGDEVGEVEGCQGAS